MFAYPISEVVNLAVDNAPAVGCCVLRLDLLHRDPFGGVGGGVDCSRCN